MKDYFDYNEFLVSFKPDDKMHYARDKNSKMKYQLEIIKNVKEEDKEALREQLLAYREKSNPIVVKKNLHLQLIIEIYEDDRDPFNY